MIWCPSRGLPWNGILWKVGSLEMCSSDLPPVMREVRVQNFNSLAQQDNRTFLLPVHSGPVQHVRLVSQLT